MIIPVESPYPWDAILKYLSHRCTPGAETIEADRYRRGNVSVEFDRAAGALRATADPEMRPRIERLFDVHHDPVAVTRAFRRCPILGPRVRILPGVRAPGCWEPFELCLRVILGQQVSVRAAHTLMGRLWERCPGLEPAAVAAADLTGIGVTSARARSLRGLAGAVASGDVVLNGHSWEDTVRALREVPGIGPWTVQYLAIRLGRDPDAFPETDLGLLHATGQTNPKQLLRLAETWRPYRSYAAMYLWTCGAP